MDENGSWKVSLTHKNGEEKEFPVAATEPLNEETIYIICVDVSGQLYAISVTDETKLSFISLLVIYQFVVAIITVSNIRWERLKSI